MSIIVVNHLKDGTNLEGLEAVLKAHIPIEKFEVVGESHRPMCILHTPCSHSADQLMCEKLSGLEFEGSLLNLYPCLFFTA